MAYCDRCGEWVPDGTTAPIAPRSLYRWCQPCWTVERAAADGHCPACNYRLLDHFGGDECPRRAAA